MRGYAAPWACRVGWDEIVLLPDNEKIDLEKELKDLFIGYGCGEIHIGMRG